MFEHRFLPLKNDDLFRNTPPPPLKDNHRACDHNAMLEFPKEQISHYTTANNHYKNIRIISINHLEKKIKTNFLLPGIPGSRRRVRLGDSGTPGSRTTRVNNQNQNQC